MKDGVVWSPDVDDSGCASLPLLGQTAGDNM